jgi:hypothetical protein
MTQPPTPPPPGGPYQQPSPYQQPPKKSRKTLWIVLGIIFGLMILTCGGCLVVGGIFVNEVDKAVEEEEANDKPTEIDLGEEFEHDDYKADAGWTVVDDGIGDFTIEKLKITNDSDDSRSAWFDFTLYKGNELLGTIDCTTSELQPGDAAVMSCTSLDDFTEDYDTIKVADAF